jgi:putative SOS response-associated peptidase YedK
MPVILERGALDDWLGGRAGVELLKPAPEGKLRRWKVSKRVNSSRTADTSELIAPV